MIRISYLNLLVLKMNFIHCIVCPVSHNSCLRQIYTRDCLLHCVTFSENTVALESAGSEDELLTVILDICMIE